MEWIPIVVQDVYASQYLKAILSTIDLVKGVSPPKNTDKFVTLWDAFAASAAFMYQICASNQYVEGLLNNPDSERLFNGFLMILEQLKDDDSKPTYSVKYHILRIFTVLCEKENPYFLDHFYKLACSSPTSILILEEAMSMYFIGNNQ